MNVKVLSEWKEDGYHQLKYAVKWGSEDLHGYLDMMVVRKYPDGKIIQESVCFYREELKNLSELMRD